MPVVQTRIQVPKVCTCKVASHGLDTDDDDAIQRMNKNKIVFSSAQRSLHVIRTCSVRKSAIDNTGKISDTSIYTESGIYRYMKVSQVQKHNIHSVEQTAETHITKRSSTFVIKTLINSYCRLTFIEFVQVVFKLG